MGMRYSELLLVGLCWLGMSSCTTAGRESRERSHGAMRVTQDCPVCPRMVAVPGGSFVIGSPVDEPRRKKNESPQRQVTIAPFAVSELEITRAQYAAFVEDTRHDTSGGCNTEGAAIDGQYELDPRASWRDPGFPQGPDHPVVCVSWPDAHDYAAWLSSKTGHHYRLLSDAEWEYVARAGTTSAYYWGVDRELGCAYANGCDQRLKRIMPAAWGGIYAACDDGAAYTTPAGHYKPNAFGLFDITGNAWEWVEDCTEPTYDGLPDDGRPRTHEGCTARDVRGGSWDDDPEDLRNASRHHTKPDNRQYDLGLRLARD